MWNETGSNRSIRRPIQEGSEHDEAIGRKPKNRGLKVTRDVTTEKGIQFKNHAGRAEG